MIIKAILSDMDGTLVNTEVANAKAYLMALELSGFQIAYEDFIEKTCGKSAKKFLLELFPNMSLMEQENVLLCKKRIYKTLLKETQLYASVHDLLCSFKKLGFPIGLVTTASKEAVDDLIMFYGLDALFNVVVTGSDVTNSKPAPDPYLVAADLLKVDISECLIFEDSEIGMQSAISSGGHLIVINN